MSQSVLLLAVVVQVPETLQYRVVKRLSRRDLTILDTMVEAASIMEARPKLTGRGSLQVELTPLRNLFVSKGIVVATAGGLTKPKCEYIRHCAAQCVKQQQEVVCHTV